MSSTLQAINVGGQTIWVEVSDIAAPATTRSKVTGTARGGTGVTGELVQADVGPTLKAVIGPIHEALKAMAPEEVSVEFALGIKGEVGFFVAKSEGNASLKVSAKWKFTAK